MLYGDLFRDYTFHYSLLKTNKSMHPGLKSPTSSVPWLTWFLGLGSSFMIYDLGLGALHSRCW